jgi:hypothetical protein
MMNGSTSKIHSENPPNSLPKGAKSRVHGSKERGQYATDGQICLLVLAFFLWYNVKLSPKEMNFFLKREKKWT